MCFGRADITPSVDASDKDICLERLDIVDGVDLGSTEVASTETVRDLEEAVLTDEGGGASLGGTGGMGWLGSGLSSSDRRTRSCKA